MDTQTITRTSELPKPAKRTHRCPVCREQFVKWRTTQKVCPKVACAAEWAKRLREKDEAKQARADRISTRQALEKLRPRRWYIDKAQDDYAAYIRARDETLPCVSCGRLKVEWTRGGEWDCGHYLSVGSHPELRFEELNSAKQCKRCNGGSGKYARKNESVRTAYRVELVRRIGLDKVEWLEGPHDPEKWTIPELVEIRKVYQLKLKGLKHGETAL